MVSIVSLIFAEHGNESEGGVPSTFIWVFVSFSWCLILYCTVCIVYSENTPGTFIRVLYDAI